MGTRPRVALSYITTGATISYSHALAALAGELRRSSWRDSELTVVRLDGDQATFAPKVLASDPAVVLVSAMSNQWLRAKQVVDNLRAVDPHVRILFGGSHAIADPSSVGTTPTIDVTVVGEADMQIVDLVNSGSGGRRNLLGPIMLQGIAAPNLDDCARPAVDLFDLDTVRAYPSVMFSRGCPYRCTYCMSREGGLGGTVRWKSPERAIAEVRDLVDYADPPLLNFDDDTLLKSPSWVRAFLRMYAREIGLPFHCNARPETVTEELAAALRSSGCAALGLGIESGSERIRAEVLGRPMTNERIVRAFTIARSAGLKTWSFNMVGLPGESAEDLSATIALNDACEPDFLRVSIYTPYPGTLLESLHPAPPSPTNYLRSPASLGAEEAAVVREWLEQLIASGRLWYTDSELQLLKVDLNASSSSHE